MQSDRQVSLLYFFVVEKSVYFCFFLFISDSYGWIVNGSFNGIMGQFQKKKIRMASHAINMRAERLNFSDFTASVFTPRLTEMKRKIISIFHRLS